MCGFAGFLAPGGLTPSDRGAIAAMGEPIAHRGPDGDGAWSDPVAGVALIHRRLSIIDLSPAGAQPMRSAGGRYVIAYNGEIYNYRELRADLEAQGKAPAWRGHSDTEVILAAIEAWGVGVALRRLSGMFALALWDARERQLVLARDRLGEKPVYYGWQGQGGSRRFLFGSDLAALRVHPAFAGELDRTAIMQLCRYLYIPEPLSVFVGIAKLRPGHFMTINVATGAQRAESYFDFLQHAADARDNPFPGGADDAVDALAGTLGDAVERQMVSDVPLGALLSGGIDSTSIVALMQARSSRPVRTFTIGFDEPDFDEASHAREVARHLATDHHELYVRPDDALAVIPRLPEIFSEPFADSSQIPTFLVSRLARTQVTVALSGDGGDELFGGYNRHRFGHVHWSAMARAPRRVRAAAGFAMRSVSPSAWDRAIGPFLRRRIARVGDKMHKVSGVLASATPDELYDHLIAVNPDAQRLFAAPAPVPGPPGEPDCMVGWSTAERMMALDALGYLPGDILTKVDRAAMAVSLETRVPFLDPAVVALAWSLPIDLKIRGGVTKWPLRRLLERFLPYELVDRPKMGFTLPLGEWLRGPLRGWAESLLSPTAIAGRGLFDAREVGALWRRHLSRAQNAEQMLWPVLMTQAWLEHEDRQSGAASVASKVAAS